MDLFIDRASKPVIAPQANCPWAEAMVLNPAILADPNSSRIHMLFRASGPFSHKRGDYAQDPYPIFLGYAWSDDSGRTWEADFSRPALAPRLAERMEDMYITNRDGQQVFNHCNGYVEDPRLCWLEEKLYLTVACRMFPPGAYFNNWVHLVCAPDWVREGNHPFGMAASENRTVSVLFEVDLDALAARRYEDAFTYVCPLTDANLEDNRDVVLFPEKLRIHGREQYVLIHRPRVPQPFLPNEKETRPSSLITAADDLCQLQSDKIEHRMLARPLFDWEDEKTGASSPPIRIGKDEWLLPFHGKKDGKTGYTQSFMILREQDDDFPIVAHRCPERVLYAKQEWELGGLLAAPCIFTCGAIRVGDELLMSYGVADTYVGVARTNFADLLTLIRKYDAEGKAVE
ncbi:MAG TPA: hypothetical protein ENL03_05950 [Phycisphaerae bacterium]|nr:hypothetical protein [Phycisphaerae bacterium]